MAAYQPLQSSPVLTVARSPVLAPARSPVLAPARSPVLAPARSPVLAPARSPVLAPARSPVLAPARSPVLAPARSPVLAAARSPVLAAACAQAVVSGSPQLKTLQYVQPAPQMTSSPAIRCQASPTLMAMSVPRISSPTIVTLTASTAQASPGLVARRSPTLVVQRSPGLAPCVVQQGSPNLILQQHASPGTVLLRSPLQTVMRSPPQRTIISSPGLVAMRSRTGSASGVSPVLQCTSSPVLQCTSPSILMKQATESTKPPSTIVQGEDIDDLLAGIQDDDDFELPPPVVDINQEEDDLKRWGNLDSDDDTELDADEHDLSQDATMVRSPLGTRWIHASRRFELDCSYSIWFEASPNMKRKARSEQQYEEGLQCVGTFSSVQEFWRYWNAMDVYRMSNFSSLSIFKSPIKPMWEDAGNQGGGQWVLRCTSRDRATEFFQKLVLSLIGGYFECHESLCGVVLSTKPKFNSLTLWNARVDPRLFVPVDHEIRELLGIANDERLSVEYKEHGGNILNNQIKRGEVNATPVAAVNTTEVGNGISSTSSNGADSKATAMAVPKTAVPKGAPVPGAAAQAAAQAAAEKAARSEATSSQHRAGGYGGYTYADGYGRYSYGAYVQADGSYAYGYNGYGNGYGYGGADGSHGGYGNGEVWT